MAAPGQTYIVTNVAPTYTQLGQRLQERTEPLQPVNRDRLFGYAHGHLCEGMMRPFEQVAEIVDPPDPYFPWEPLFNVNICPDWALPWLAQVVGVRYPAFFDADQAREAIRGLSIQKRGTPAAIATALAITLTGNKTVYFRERDQGDPYALEIVTLDAETPNPAQSLVAINTQLPAGLILRFRQTEAWDYQAMTTEWMPKGPYSTLPTTFQTYLEMKENER